jgi:serine/threonine protein kinase
MKEGGKDVALKISRNKKFDTDNANVEFKLLQTLKDKDPQDSKGVVRVLDCFSFRKHVVLSFELLGVNLYKTIHQDLEKSGLEKNKIRDIAFQMSSTLSFIKEVGIIHCDLKPENILFTDARQ